MGLCVKIYILTYEAVWEIPHATRFAIAKSGFLLKEKVMTAEFEVPRYCLFPFAMRREGFSMDTFSHPENVYTLFS